MSICIAMFCFTVAVVGKIFEKKIINPLTIFYSLWTIIFYLYSLGLYNLNRASDSTLKVMLLGLIAFVIGYIIVKLFYHRTTCPMNRQVITQSDDDEYNFNYNIIYILLLFCIIFTGIQAIQNAAYLISGETLNYIRQNAQNSTAGQTGLVAAIRNVIVNPFTMALQPIVACDFWQGKRNKNLLASDILLLILRTIADGSRSSFIYLVIHFIVAYIFSVSKSQPSENIDLIKDNKKNRKRRNRRIMIWGGSVGLFFIIITTFSRSGTNLAKYSYYYFSMQPYMMEFWSNVVNNAHMVGYGLASTNGFSFSILYVLHNLGMGDYPTFWHSINLMIANTTSEWQVISGDGNLANAYVSLFWYFFLDGGIAGVFIGSLLYGGISSVLYLGAMKYSCVRQVCIYSFILQGLLMSFVRFQFADMSYALAFIMILLLIRKRRVNK